MNSITIKFLKLSKLSLAILLTAFLLTSFNTIMANEMMSASSSQVLKIASAEKLWKGEPKGYVSQGNPTTDSVAFLVRLGRVQAAIGRVNSYDKEKGMANPFTAKVLAGYEEIDPFVNGKSRKNLSLQPLLSEMAAHKTFELIMSKSSSQRKERNAISVQLRALILRVDGIVTEHFPSTRASALGMSALLREAGELLMTGLSKDGRILDISKYRDALQLMEASLRLRVNKVTSCNRSRDSVKQLKSRGPLGDLLDRMIVISTSGTLDGNAGDVFEAAENLEKLGESLPADDKQICQ